jgi:hypothetical protein
MRHNPTQLTPARKGRTKYWRPPGAARRVDFFIATDLCKAPQSVRWKRTAERTKNLITMRDARGKRATPSFRLFSVLGKIAYLLELDSRERDNCRESCSKLSQTGPPRRNVASTGRIGPCGLERLKISEKRHPIPASGAHFAFRFEGR